jgi:hypothetical protein
VPPGPAEQLTGGRFCRPLPRSRQRPVAPTEGSATKNSIKMGCGSGPIASETTALSSTWAFSWAFRKQKATCQDQLQVDCPERARNQASRRAGLFNHLRRPSVAALVQFGSADASRCTVVEAIDGFISGVGPLDVIRGSTIDESRRASCRLRPKRYSRPGRCACRRRQP